MCTSPILIKNRRFRSVDIDMPNSYVKVPCGCCDECLSKRQRELFLRAKFEAESTILHGGCGFMCCLTYGPQLAPKLYDNGKMFYVFNKQHVIYFIKRLRVNLDRYFQKLYGTSAPDFKYIVTSEFGTSDEGLHLPHYHLIILFSRQVGLSTFRKAFVESLVNRRDKKRIFGYIYQCSPLDIKAGGVQYVCKYILKDIEFAHQDEVIRRYIRFNTDAVNQEFNIIDNPKSVDDYVYNKSIRSRKDYRKNIKNRVGKYRDMLQFYLCSNDFGLSSIIDRYGDNLLSLGMLNVEGFAYSIPKQVLSRFERVKGTYAKDSLSKTVFLESFRQATENLVSRNMLTRSHQLELLDFVEVFTSFRGSALYFNLPILESVFYDVENYGKIAVSDILDAFGFIDDNDFFSMRNEVYSIINLNNSPDRLLFRASVAHRKCQEDKLKELERKRNKCRL